MTKFFVSAVFLLLASVCYSENLEIFCGLEKSPNTLDLSRYKSSFSLHSKVIFDYTKSCLILQTTLQESLALNYLLEQTNDIFSALRMLPERLATTESLEFKDNAQIASALVFRSLNNLTFSELSSGGFSLTGQIDYLNYLADKTSIYTSITVNESQVAE